ncbi:MAG: hypothetical protein KDC95_21330, partial [Planctomycetes bacterium]|nr:hypothetical protein [Planctomycetota bacterium]
MKRPSQFMLVFVAVAGTTFATLGDDLTPTKPVFLGKPSVSADDGPRIVARGSANDTPLANIQPPALRGPWTLHGRVLGESVSGTDAIVHVGLELVPLGDGRHTSQALLSTRTTENGTYAWDGLLPGQYRLRALPAEEHGSHLAVAVDVELPETKEAKKDAEHDVILPLPRTMHGIVRSRLDLPKSFARISISETGLHRGTAVLDRAGKFTIERVGPGP